MLTCASLKKIFLSYFHLQVKPKVSEGVSEPRFHLELGGFEPEIFFFSEAHGNIPILLSVLANGKRPKIKIKEDTGKKQDQVIKPRM